MDTLAPLLTYAAALAVAAATPGPGVAALVGQALGNGLRSALFFLGGIALGDVVWLSVAVAGLAALAQVFAGALLVVKLAGGAYLIWLAWKFWTSESGLVRAQGATQQNGMRSFVAGFTVTLGNPKTIIFYMALLPSVLDLRKVHLAEWSLLSALTVLVLFAVLSPYAVLAAKARGMMKSTDGAGADQPGRCRDHRGGRGADPGSSRAGADPAGLIPPSHPHKKKAPACAGASRDREGVAASPATGLRVDNPSAAPRFRRTRRQFRRSAGIRRFPSPTAARSKDRVRSSGADGKCGFPAYAW